VSNLKKGDKVVTNGGIHGTVVGVADRVVVLRIAENVKVEVAKGCIASLQPKKDEE
jgi:preprotein translocase subunit YajC